MTRPSPEDLLAETARLAYHLHWPLDTILDLEHRDRRAFLAESDALAGLMWEEEEEDEEHEEYGEFEAQELPGVTEESTGMTVLLPGSSEYE